MPNIVIEEVTETRRQAPNLNKELTLTAGHKISDDNEVFAYATRACPDGYKIKVMVMMNVTGIEKL